MYPYAYVCSEVTRVRVEADCTALPPSPAQYLRVCCLCVCARVRVCVIVSECARTFDLDNSVLADDDFGVRGWTRESVCVCAWCVCKCVCVHGVCACVRVCVYVCVCVLYGPMHLEVSMRVCVCVC
jgi:hypothetical protein